MSVLDRYILRSLLVNYVIALTVMVSLYVFLDLFVNIDEFIEHHDPLWRVALHVVDYYGPNVFVYFAQLSGVITAFACMVTIARMRRLNEMTAFLASGVSLYRIAIPIVVFGCATTALMIVDTEWVIPRCAHLLARKHEDVGRRGAYEVLLVRDRRGALVSAAELDPERGEMRNVLVLLLDDDGNVRGAIDADRATWHAPQPGQDLGRWHLDRGRRTTRTVRTGGDLMGPGSFQEVAAVEDFETDLTPKELQLRQSESWVQYLSLRQLTELARQPYADLRDVMQTRHERFAQPIIAVVLLLLALPFFLDRSPEQLLSDTGKCMAVVGLCYATTFVARGIDASGTSALPYWIPIFIFATIATVLIDRVRT
jgi:lipopolysaccharide export LptBFGC system permease protein LptF